MSKTKQTPAANRTLVVLGAGASIAAAKYPIENSWRAQHARARMPSGDNFFHDLFFQDKTETHGKRYLNVLGLTSEGVNDLIVRAWGLKNNMKHFDPEEWKQINIEAVFTFLDIGQRMYLQGTSYQLGFKVCKRELEAFITSFLSISSDGFHCEQFLHILLALQPTDTIVSFNWDTIADFTVQQSGGPLYSGYIDLMKADPLRVVDFVHRGVLLKLHGSLNWMMCPNPKCALHGKVRLAVRKGRLLRFREMHKCPACGNDHGEPLIVPPTSQKFIPRGTLLHKMWLLAREQLQYCRRIVFIGYSFPTTDFYSEWLFRQIYFLEGGLPEIIVVNPEIMKKRSAVSRRYHNIFRGCTMHRFPTLKAFQSEGLGLLKTDDREPTTRRNTTTCPADGAS
jgi:hypothetical protein